MKVQVKEGFILISARLECGDLVKLKFIGYTKAEALKSFKTQFNKIQNFN